jgi:predicted neutral ceramidase superfamily lipid hydrolase
MTKFDPSKTSKRWMLYMALAALVSWAGWWSVVQLPINDLTKTLFFVLLFAAIGSSLMPAIAYLNARFGRFRNERTYYARFVRQSILASAFAIAIAWLQMRHVLSSTLALILLAVFVLTETFLITREAPPEEP